MYVVGMSVGESQGPCTWRYRANHLGRAKNKESNIYFDYYYKRKKNNILGPKISINNKENPAFYGTAKKSHFTASGYGSA